MNRHRRAVVRGCVDLGANAIDLSFASIGPKTPVAEHQHVAGVASDAQDVVAVSERCDRLAIKHHLGGITPTQIEQLKVTDACGAATECEVVAVAAHLQGVEASAAVDCGIRCLVQQAHVGDMLVVVAVAEGHVPHQGVVAVFAQQGVVFCAAAEGVVARTTHQAVAARATDQAVVATATVQRVGAVATTQGVIASVAPQGFSCATAASECVVAFAAFEQLRA